MKSFIAFLFLAVLFVSCDFFKLTAQNNLLPNPGFEQNQSGETSNCFYADFVNAGAWNFDDDVAWWKVAKHNDGKGENTADWIDRSTCGINTRLHTKNLRSMLLN